MNTKTNSAKIQLLFPWLISFVAHSSSCGCSLPTSLPSVGGSCTRGAAPGWSTWITLVYVGQLASTPRYLLVPPH